MSNYNTKPNTYRQRLVAEIIWYLLVGIFIALPFHAFVTTWLASLFGHESVIKAWKEILLALTVVPMLYVIGANKLFPRLLKNWVFRLCVLYALLHVVMAIVRPVNASAWQAGLLFNLRFILYYLLWYSLILARPDLLKRFSIKRYLLTPAMVCATFAVVQTLLLPKDFLSHFGYSEATIKPYMTVDDKPNLVRFASTLRGPNQFAVYLMIAITFVIGFGKRLARRYRWTALAAMVFALTFTYSRSGIIAVFVSLACLAGIGANKARFVKLAKLTAVVVIVAGGLLVIFRNEYYVQNYLFHADENSAAPVSSNDVRLQANKTALKDIMKHPLGTGPGSAGPASFYNTAGPRISENYYLQIAQEVGWAGLALFVSINTLVLWRLYKICSQPARVLFAAGMGVMAANLLMHAWADEVIAMVWWGLAAMEIAGAEQNVKLRL